jgi:hypothetical protein
MDRRATNFADPGFEPTDDDLRALMTEAFAGLAGARQESLREMRERIRFAQAEAFERVKAWKDSRAG